MNPDYYGGHQDIGVAEIKEMLAANSRHYSGVRIRTVKGMAQGQWCHLLTMVQPFPREIAPERQPSRRYPNALLLEEWIQPDQLLLFITDGLVKNRATVDGELLDRAGGGGLSEPAQLHPGQNPYSQYPGRLYRTVGHSERALDGGDLLGHSESLPYYLDHYEAMRAWTGVPIHHGMGDTRIGSVLVFMPECRARIVGFAHEDGVLTVSLALAEPIIPDLRLKGAWQENDHWPPFDVSVEGASVELPVPMSAEGLNMFLIGPDERRYDFHQESRYSCEGQERVLGFSKSKPLDVQALEEALRAGEGETIEFKPFLERKHQKEDEIVETVISFGNTRGGAIFLGVSDYCEVIGSDQDLVKAFPGQGGDLDKAIQEYIGYLRKMLPDKMNHCPMLHYNVVLYGDHKVLMIGVQEGEDKIYERRRDNAIFVRRGASNRRATADVDVPQLVRLRLLRRQGMLSEGTGFDLPGLGL